MRHRVYSQLLSLFDIRAAEARLVGLLLLYSLFLGAAVSMSYAAAAALFLEAFTADELPWVYIIGAIITVAGGVVYNWLEKRLAFGTLFQLTLGFLAVTGILMRLGFAVSTAAWLAFAVLNWFRLFFALLGLAFWGVAARLLTLQQGKRLFGLIGAGEVLAKVAGYALVPALVGRIGTVNLLWIAVACVLGGMGALAAMLRVGRSAASSRKPQPAPSAAQRHASAPVRSRVLLRQRYVQLILAASLLATLLYFLVDFGFLQQVRTQYTDADELAAFLGVISSIAYGGSLIVRVFLSGWLLRRFGLRLGILLLPALMLLPLLITLVASSAGVGLIVFWSIIALRLLNDLLGTGIHRSSFVLLYQPLERRRRLTAQALAESVFQPLGTGLAGLCLLLFGMLPEFTLLQLSIFMLVLTGLWLAVTVWTFRHYLLALTAGLAQRALSGAQLTLADAATVAAIEKTLASDYPAEVVYALDLLERAAEPIGDDRLTALLRHSSADVRAAALDLIERHHRPGFLETIRAMAAADPSLAVRGAAMRAWAALDSADAVENLLRYVNDETPVLREAALVALLRRGGIAGVLAAGEQLLRMVEAPEPATRAAAATILGRVEAGGYYQPLLTLLADPSPQVARAALIAAGGVNSRPLWPRVADALRSPQLARAAGAALVRGGEHALPTIRAVFTDPGSDRDVLARLAQVLGRIESAESIAILAPHIAYPEREVRARVLRALVRRDYAPSGAARAPVDAQLAREVAGVFAMLGAAEAATGNEILTFALDDERLQAIKRLFLLLALLYGRQTVMRARDTLLYAAVERRGYALELLDNLLSQRHKRLIFPLLEELPASQRRQQLSDRLGAPFAPDEAFETLFDYHNPNLSDWTLALALTTLQANEAALLDRVDAARRAPQPLVREAALWVAYRVTGSTAVAADWLSDPHPYVAATAHRLQAARPGELTMLSTIERVIVLKTVGIFGQTSDAILAEIAHLLEEVTLQPGERVIEYGEPGNSLYIIVSGRMLVHVGEKKLNELGAREVFGEMAVLDPAPRMASVTAMEEARLLRLGQEPLFELMESRGEVARGILQVVIRRLRDRVSDLNAIRDRVRELEQQTP